MHTFLLLFSFYFFLRACIPGKATRQWCHWHWSYALDAQLRPLHVAQTEGCYVLKQGRNIHQQLSRWCSITKELLCLKQKRRILPELFHLWTPPSPHDSRSPWCATSPILGESHCFWWWISLILFSCCLVILSLLALIFVSFCCCFYRCIGSTPSLCVHCHHWSPWEMAGTS